MDLIIQTLLNGLSLGTTYALIALGYTMVYGILNFINFAHGDVFMVGAFIGYYIVRYLHFSPDHALMNIGVVLLIPMCGAGLMGFFIERFAYRPLRKMPRINTLITAIGVSLSLQYGGQILFGADPKFFPVDSIFPQQIYALTEGVSFTNSQGLTLLVSILLMVGLQFLVRMTKVGKAMRAVSNNMAVAELMGISTNRIVSLTFMIGSALAAAGGILYCFSYPRLDPNMGMIPGLKAFVAAVFGGIGSIPGAMVGGLLMGFLETIVMTTSASTYRDAVAFIVLILLLLLRPAGLFGKLQPEKV